MMHLPPGIKLRNTNNPPFTSYNTVTPTATPEVIFPLSVMSRIQYTY